MRSRFGALTLAALMCSAYPAGYLWARVTHRIVHYTSFGNGYLASAAKPPTETGAFQWDVFFEPLVLCEEAARRPLGLL